MADAWPDKFEVSAMYVDPSMGADAKRGDYSAIVFAGWAFNKLWVECDMERRPPTEITRDTIAMYKRLFPDAVGCESNGFQNVIAEALEAAFIEERLGDVPVYRIKNSINKIIRITQRLDPYLARKEIRIRDDKGGRLLVNQLRDFPLADHDDGPDALEGAIRLIMELLCEGD